MSKPVILVLEDAEVRVEWLRDKFESVATIVHATTVTAMLDELERWKGSLALVILDHDLGTLQPNGADNMCGSDAARLLDVRRDIPILIWSWNPVGASQMMLSLTDHGYTSVSRLPFEARNFPSMAQYILRAVTKPVVDSPAVLKLAGKDDAMLRVRKKRKL